MRKRASSGTQSIGQLLIIGFDGAEISPRLTSLLKEIQPAGVILFARNIKSADQTWHLLHECQRRVAAPLFTCIDLEGGTVDRLRDVLGPTPSAADVFAAGDRKLFRKHGHLIAQNCRSFGFNVDFAPVFDLGFEPSRRVMASRTVSADARKSMAYARGFLSGLRTGKVLGCGKHFPGLGEANLDSHRNLPVIKKPLKKLWAEDLLSYRTLHPTLPFVMVAHAAYPEVTGNKTPASLSPLWIQEILRKRIGYRNLIVSDDLEMGGVLAAATIGKAAVEAIRAGSDLCLVCHHEDRVREVYEKLIRTAERDRDFADQAAEAAGRVTACKKKWARILQTEKTTPSKGRLDSLERALWEFSEQVRLSALNRRDNAEVRARRA